MSELEENFAGQLRMLFMAEGWDQDAIVREYEFCPDRKWRCDFAISGWVQGYRARLSISHFRPDILIEIEGGTRSGGRHNRHGGYTNDAFKYSAASALGYTLLRGTSQMVHDGTLLMMVTQVLKGELELKDWKAA